MNAYILGLKEHRCQDGHLISKLVEVDPNWPGTTLMVHGAENYERVVQWFNEGVTFATLTHVFCANCGDYFPIGRDRCSCGSTERQDRYPAEVVVVRF